MSKDTLDVFGQILLTARSSGPNELRDRWLAGWRPKRMDDDEAAISSFLDALAPSQRALLLRVVTYFVDASIFKLIVTLEDGEAHQEFKLSMRNSATGDETLLVDPDVDNDLKHLFFKWRRAFGAI